MANVRALEPIAHNYSSHVPLDALHVVDENICNALQRVDGDICKVQEVVAEKRVLASKDGSSGVGANVHLDDAPGSTKRNGIRFPRDAVMVLRHWFDAHTDHPYPTSEQKADLEMRTQLKPSQIADWLANARRRQKGESLRASIHRPDTDACRLIYPSKLTILHNLLLLRYIHPYHSR